MQQAPRPLDRKSVLRLLREQIKQAGGQSAWARNTGVERATVNRTVTGLCPLRPSILKAMGIEKAGFYRGNGSDRVFLDDAALLALLHHEIARIGGPIAWSRQAAVDRTYLYRALHGSKPARAAIAAALGLKIAYRRRDGAGGPNVADRD